MNKYNPNATCCKCGFEHITVEFMPERKEVFPPFYYGGGTTITVQKEHIRRKCCNCGYSWKEEPLNKDCGGENAP